MFFSIILSFGCGKKSLIPEGTYVAVESDETLKNYKGEEIHVSSKKITLEGFNWDYRIEAAGPLLAAISNFTPSEQGVSGTDDLKNHFDFEKYKSLEISTADIYESNIEDSKGNAELVYQVDYKLVFSNGFEFPMSILYSPKRGCFVGNDMDSNEIIPIYVKK